MTDKATLQAQLASLEQQAAPYLADARKLAGGPGADKANYITEDDLSNPQLTEAQLLFKRYNLPIPATVAFKYAPLPQIISDLNQVEDLFTRAGAIYAQLYPPGGLSTLAMFGLFVAAVLVIVAAQYELAPAVEGAAGTGVAGAAPAAAPAAAAAASGAATAATVATPALTTIGTGAALTTTAGTLAEASTALSGAGLATAATAAAGAATTATSLATTLGNGIADLTGSSTLGALVSDVAGNIGSVVQDIEQFIKPLTDFASQILTGIQDLNKQFIQPVADFISKDYTTITGLVTEVHTLADSGLKGILAIPDALASAFTGLDAANQRLAQQTGVINQGIAANTLVPGIGEKIASPLGDIHTLLNTAWNTPIPDVGNIETVKLDETLFNPGALAANFNKATTKLASMGVVGKVVAVLVDSFNDILGYLASVENLVELAKQKGNQDLPVEPLGVEETIDAWWKDHFDEQTALTELARHGFDPTRARALYALKEWLPDANTAISMFYKGVITSDEVAGALTRQGYSQADINALANAALEPVNPREAIAVAGRAAAAAAGFLRDTLQTPIPDDLKLLYPARLTRADVGNFDWLVHWNIQSIDWWITAWYRGLASDAELGLAAQALNIPPELVPSLTAVAGQTVQLWMIPDMMAKGVFTETQAKDYLKYIGIEPKSVDVLIEYGKVSANAGKGPDLLGLGKISEGNAKQMLIDGIIDKSEYNSVLIAHGYTEQAATLMADLVQQQMDLTARKSFAQHLIQEYDLGQIALQDLQSQLGTEGYTQTEIENYVQEALTGALKKAKRLSNTDVKDFLKAGIFTEYQVLTTLTANGWSHDYAQAFIKLWTQTPPATNPSGAAPGTSP